MMKILPLKTDQMIWGGGRRWIHGGAFHWGSASSGPEGKIDGAQLALRSGAIVVAVQYVL